MKPNYEQLESELAKTRSELVEAKRKLVKATDLLQRALEEIADLKEKLNLNSKNSSKPPSSDQKRTHLSGTERSASPAKV